MTKKIVAIVVAVAICLTLTVVALTSMAGDSGTNSKALTLISNTVKPKCGLSATGTTFDGSDAAAGVLAMNTGTQASGYVAIGYGLWGEQIDLTGYRYLTVDVNVPNTNLDADTLHLQLRTNETWDKVRTKYTGKESDAPISAIKKGEWVTLVYTLRTDITAEQIAKTDGYRLAIFGSATPTATQVKFKNLTAYKNLTALTPAKAGDVLMDPTNKPLVNKTGVGSVKTVGGKSAYGYTADTTGLKQIACGEIGHANLSDVDGISIDFYIDDATKISGDLVIELTSSFDYNSWKIQYDSMLGGKFKNGWNTFNLDVNHKKSTQGIVEGMIPYDRIGSDGGAFDVGNFNYIRVYAVSLAAGATAAVGNITAYKVPSASSEVSSATSSEASSATSSEATSSGEASSENPSSETASVDTKTYLIEAREGEKKIACKGAFDATKNDYGDGTNGAYWYEAPDATKVAPVEHIFETGSVDISAAKSLTLWVYMDAKAAASAKDGQIEVTSAGVCDKQERSWWHWESKMKAGWNKLVLDLQNEEATAKYGQGYHYDNGADLKKINYVRVYTFCEGTIGVGAFYVTPAGVDGGDYTNILMIVAALTLAGGAALTTIFCGKKAR